MTAKVSGCVPADGTGASSTGAKAGAVIEKLTHEIAILKRNKFARRSEQLDYVPV